MIEIEGRRQLRTVRQQNGGMHEEAGQNGALKRIHGILATLQRHLHPQQEVIFTFNHCFLNS